MPIYEYHCEACLADFEALRPMGRADEPIRCHQCESTRTRRTLSLFNAQSSDADGRAVSFGAGCGCGGACSCGHRHS